MKFFLILILGIATSCFVSTSQNSLDDDSAESLLHYSTSNFTMLYDVKSQNFYYLQTKTKLSLPKTFVFLKYESGLVAIYDESTEKEIRYTLGENVYGITKMRGGNLENNLLERSGAGFVPDIDTVISELSLCHCFANGGDVLHDCSSGGPGSNSCTYAASSGDGCDVSCSDGYFSCCTGD